MTLLNGILAFGALAFTVPLAIHLLFRSRFRTIEWGAMHLLDAVVRINRRRIQLLHLLLLLVRCLLPVLLAFCLARPLLTGFQSLPGDAPQSLVLVVDDSRSMAAHDSTGLSRLDRVQQEMGEVFKGLSRRDEVILIRSSRVDSPSSATGAQDAIDALRRIRADFGPVDLGRLLQAAVEASNDASHAQRRIIVASDFQSQIVSDGAVQSISRMTSRLEEKSIRPVISFWNVGSGSEQLENVLVESIELDSPAVVAGRTARFSAEIRNAGDRPLRDLRLVWSIDDTPLTPVPITIPPRSTVTSRVSRSIDDVGVHQVSVSVEHGDALVEDNRRSIGVDVIREIRVLLVDGQPSNRPLRGETDFLAIALSPFAFGGEDQPDAVRTKVTTPGALAGALQSDPPDVVVLANVGDLRTQTKTAISEFVLDGGSLVLFDGDQVRPEIYNEPWRCEAGSWQLPGRMGSVVGVPWSPNNEDGVKSYAVGLHNAQYAPWDVLGTSDDRPFSNMEVTAYRKLVVDENETAAKDANGPSIRLLDLANGDPLVLTARRGRGAVVQFAIPGDTGWSNLPTRLVYLPMLQQLVLDLAGSRKQTTIDVGQEFSVAVEELSEVMPPGAVVDENGRTVITVEVPGGSELPLKPTEEDSPQVVVSTQHGPGVYRLRRTVPLLDEKPWITRTDRVVEVPAVESQLREVDGSRLNSAASAVDAKVYASLQQIQDEDRSRRYGREIWRWFLIALLVAMVAELLLQQIAVRISTAGVR